MSMWIAPTSIHVCWCSSASSSQSRKDLDIFDFIFAPSFNTTPSTCVGGSMAKLYPLMMMRNLFKKFLQNPGGVCKFAIYSMF